MSDLNKLLQKRSQLKGNVTRFQTFLNKCRNEPQHIFQLPSRLDKLKECWPLFNSVQEEIESLEVDSNLAEVHENVRLEFEDAYFLAESEAQALIPCEQPAAVARTRSNESIREVTSGNQVVHVKQFNQYKLPQLDVPKFSGNYEDWVPFKELFKAIIDENLELQDIHKLYFLRLALKDGLASKLLDSVELTSQNYKIAWELLTTRYQNERIIVERHVKALFELPKVDRESSRLLRQLIDNTYIHLKALKSLNLPVDSWDTLLLHLLVKKLDDKTSKEWQIASTSDNLPTLNDFELFVNKRCQILEAIDSSRDSYTSSRTKEIRPQYFNHKRKFTSYYNTADYQGIVSPKCCICNELHKIFVCPQFIKMNQKAKMERVIALRLCNNCLRVGHIARECRVSIRCSYCQGKHNSLLHDQQSETTDTMKGYTQSTPASVNHALHHSNHPNVLISTAIVDVKNSSGRFIPCRALLDPGSSVNVMTESLAQHLGLNHRHTQTSISGINETHSQAIYTANTTIRSRYTNFNEHLSFVIQNNITQLLPAQRINLNSLNLPRKIFFADPKFHIPNKVDILIGAEIFYDLLYVGQIRLGDHRPVLQKTALGWIVAGKLPEHPHKEGQHSHVTTSCTPEKQVAGVYALNNTDHDRKPFTERDEEPWVTDRITRWRRINQPAQHVWTRRKGSPHLF